MSVSPVLGSDLYKLYILYFPVWHGEMCEVLGHFIWTAKQVLIIFNLSVFWDVPSLRITRGVGCCDSELTKHHVGPLCWLLADTGAVAFTTCCKFPKYPEMTLIFFVSLTVCTGPVFRWRQYIPPLCYKPLQISFFFFFSPCFCKNSYFANQ